MMRHGHAGTLGTSGTACSRPLSPPSAALTDPQKAALARLWTAHSSDLDASSTGGCDALLGSSGSDLDNRTYLFVARIYSFLVACIDSAALVGGTEDEEDGVEGIKEHGDFIGAGTSTSVHTKRNANANHHGMARIGQKTFASLCPLLCIEPFYDDQDVKPHLRSLRPRKKRSIRPRCLSAGRNVLQFDHDSFNKEFNSYEHPQLSGNIPEEYLQQHTFGSFLYHLPERAMAAFGCAVGLTLSELIRKGTGSSTLMTPQQNESIGRILDQTRYFIRFNNVYPLCRMNDVKTNLLGRFITVKGHVTRARPKCLRVVTADFQCGKCGDQFSFRFAGGLYAPPERCPTPKCRSKTFVLCRSTARYIDCQRIKLSETQDETSGDAGRTPRQLDVDLADELVDSCHAGDVLHVAGIVRAVNSAAAAGRGGRRAQETSTYKLYLTANSIINTSSESAQNRSRNGDDNGENSGNNEDSGATALAFTSEQLARICQLAHADHMYGPLACRMAFPFDLLVRSICPAIIGHDLVKAGILLGLLGGTPSESSGLLNTSAGMTIRSNIHVLIVGDPGMGKSQMLLAATQVVTRSVYVGGNSASSTGLTVSLTKESSGEVGIEAGALVLSDLGVCCIDEFDKMEKTHHDGLLEAMEQQQVSIAKAGVVASLPARCSVIAAANPRNGKYNIGKTVAENINMASPLLSRFDLVFILRDKADAIQDMRVSSNIMGLYREGNSGHGAFDDATGANGMDSGSNMKNIFAEWAEGVGSDRIPMLSRLPWVAETQKQSLPADLVRDYIAYAREFCHPKMTPAAAEVLKKYFMELRYPTNKTKDNVPITTRQLEALIRLSQARAKACLRDFVLKEDADDVVELMRESVRQVHVCDEAGHVDKSRGGAGGVSNRKGKKAFEKALRRRAGMTSDGKIYMNDVYRAANEVDLGYDVNAKDLIDGLWDQGTVMRKRHGDVNYYTFTD